MDLLMALSRHSWWELGGGNVDYDAWARVSDVNTDQACVFAPQRLLIEMDISPCPALIISAWERYRSVSQTHLSESAAWI